MVLDTITRSNRREVTGKYSENENQIGILILKIIQIFYI